MPVTITGRNSFGTEVGFSPTTAAAIVAIGGLINIGSVNLSKTVLDITNHGTTDGYTQVMPSQLVRTSPITLQAIFLTTSSMMTSTILTAYEARAKTRLTITVAGTSSMNQFICEGYVTDYGITTPLDDKITFEMSYKIVGKPTLQSAT